MTKHLLHVWEGYVSFQLRLEGMFEIGDRLSEAEHHGLWLRVKNVTLIEYSRKPLVFRPKHLWTVQDGGFVFRTLPSPNHYSGFEVNKSFVGPKSQAWYRLFFVHIFTRSGWFELSSRLWRPISLQTHPRRAKQQQHGQSDMCVRLIFVLRAITSWSRGQ